MPLDVTTVIDSAYLIYPTIISGSGQFVSASFTGSTFYDTRFHGPFGIFNTASFPDSSVYAFVYDPTTGYIGTNRTLASMAYALDLSGSFRCLTPSGSAGTYAPPGRGEGGDAFRVYTGAGGKGANGIPFFYPDGMTGGPGGQIYIQSGPGGQGGAPSGGGGGTGGAGGDIYIRTGGPGTPGSGAPLNRAGNIILTDVWGGVGNNVGIGTTADPTYKLQVEGTFYVGSHAEFHSSVEIHGPVEINDSQLSLTDGAMAHFGSDDAAVARLEVGTGFGSALDESISITTAQNYSSSIDFIEEIVADTDGFGTANAYGFRWVYSGNDSKLFLQSGYDIVVSDGKLHGGISAEPYFTILLGNVAGAQRYIGIQNQTPTVALDVSGAIHCRDGFRIRDAYTPADTSGVAGDLSGSIAWDADYLYVCVDNYSDGLGDIWSRTALTFGW